MTFRVWSTIVLLLSSRCQLGAKARVVFSIAPYGLHERWDFVPYITFRRVQLTLRWDTPLPVEHRVTTTWPREPARSNSFSC